MAAVDSKRPVKNTQKHSMKFMKRLLGDDPKSDERKSVWESANVIDQYGVSVFQRTIEMKIESNLRAAGLRLHGRAISDQRSNHIAATIPELHIELSIYRDHVQVKNIIDSGESFCMEWFDDLTPNDHYDAIDEYFNEMIALYKESL